MHITLLLHTYIFFKLYFKSNPKLNKPYTKVFSPRNKEIRWYKLNYSWNAGRPTRNSSYNIYKNNLQTKRHYLRKPRVFDPHRSPWRTVGIKHHWLAKKREVAVQNRTLLIMYECIPKVLGTLLKPIQNLYML